MPLSNPSSGKHYPFLVVVAVAAVLFVHSFPEKIAVRRHHPYVDAVVATAWMGLLTLGLLMPLAFVWAMVPVCLGRQSKAKNRSLPAE